MYNATQPTRRPGANGNGNGPTSNMNGGNPGEYSQYAPANVKAASETQHSMYAPQQPQQPQHQQHQQQQQSFYQQPMNPYAPAPPSPPSTFSSFSAHSPVLQTHSPPSAVAQPPPMAPLSQYSQQPPLQFSNSFSSPEQPSQFAPQQQYSQPQQSHPQHPMQQQQQQQSQSQHQQQSQQQFMQPQQHNFMQPQPQPQQSFQQHPQMMQQQQGQQPGAFGMPQALGGMGMMIGAMAQQFNNSGQAPPGPAGAAQAAAALAPQLMQGFGVPNYFPGAAGPPPADGSTFLRIPKHYFAVNHAYVLKKLALLLMPFQRRSWSRRAGVDQRQFERQGEAGATAFLPPRDDVNAPDLYIPVMSFVSYVLLVGFVFGTRGSFSAEILAMYFSSGLVVVSLEVLMIKLGLYLINARATPWLDVIAYRGYKFAGIISALLADLVLPHVAYVRYGVLLYAATAHAIFLMRSHRRIILPRGEAEAQGGADIPQRNLFLMVICVLQYPIYWLLLIMDTKAIRKA